MASWPQLKSINLTGLSWYQPVTPENLFATQTGLRSVELGLEASNTIPVLPLSVRSVALKGYTVNSVDAEGESGTARHIYDRLSPVAAQLRHLSLKRRYRTSLHGGLHALLVSSLRDVRELSIPAFAVTDLASALGGLAQLEELEVRTAYTEGLITPDQVVRLLTEASTLRKVTIEQGIVRWWEREERKSVREAAQLKHIRLVEAYMWDRLPVDSKLA